ncbi:MAG: HYR domain-containing protein [Bacteroidales bacterium]|nr:MAG: HYR domain-containing protein [Bacteroidales bacterium]
MKTLIFWILVLTIVSVSNAQNVYIPDENFKNYLIEEGRDTDGDGEISYSEAENIGDIRIFTEEIIDFTGIEAFVNLWYFYCTETYITSLDLSNKKLLVELHCHHNNRLTSLNVTGCTSLEILECYNNNLTSLDVSSCKALKTLDCKCNYNLIGQSLDLTGCVALQTLWCGGNGLINLNVTKNENLGFLYCWSNQLTSLDLSNNPRLALLMCDRNELTSLDLSQTNVIWLDCSSNNLTSLDIRNSENHIMLNFEADDNNLTCINVDDELADHSAWVVDPGVRFSNDCGDFITIPDPNFEQALIDLGIDSDNAVNHKILRSDAEGVTTLDISNPTANPNLPNVSGAVSDLTGIEAFINLTTLDCSKNQLENLNFSQNSALTQLICSENILLSLNISANPELVDLRCDNNLLGKLYVSNNTALDILWCQHNQIKSLDLSNNTLLRYLICHHNYIYNIDLSNNGMLSSFAIGSNLIEYIDVSQNPDLQYLACNDLQLSGLDVSSNLMLSTLACFNSQLTDLDLSQNINLVDLICSDNELTSLDVRNGNNSILQAFDATNNPSLTCIQVDNETDANAGLPPYDTWQKDATAGYSEDCEHFGLTYVPDDNFEQALIYMEYDDVLDDYVLTSNISGITLLDVSNKSIGDLTGIEDFISLIYLNCSNNHLSELDISNIQTLKLLVCNNNMLPVLDVSQNLPLQRISCSNNLLTSLDVSQHASLLILECGGNDLPGLNVSNNTLLNTLECSNNPLGTLDVLQNLVLERLYCGSNQLSTLDIRQNSDLIYLHCSHNSLKQLDVSNNTNLQLIHCAGNDLESLDVSNHPQLFGLFCYENRLESLDLSNNPVLSELWCRDNELEELNVKNGNNANVTTFEADENLLSCITVDDELADHTDWKTDPGVIFSNDCGYNTQRGESVDVLPVDETTETTPVEVTFEAVNLSGNTSLETTETGPEFPSGFAFGDPLTYYDVSTTAEFLGPVQIAIDYSGMVFDNEEGLRLLHYESNQWLDVTTMLDTDNDMIYGEVTSLSPFGILEDIEPPVFSENSDIIINDPGPTGAYVEFDIPTATDNSPGVVVEQTDGTGLTSGSFFPLGATTLSYLATDVAGNTATCSFDVILNNLPPVIDEIIAPVDPFSLGTEATVTVLFTDDNLVEAKIDWGDGTDIMYGDIIDQSITWNYTYSTPGVYPVSVQLIDIGGKTAEETYRYIVVYDPAGGFVTGGGWINSPPGAYVDDPLLEGKANFGFVSKYKKGSNIPEGNTEFQFNAGDLKFKSTSYYWLVIAGSKAKFKGEGIINGLGTYGFMISAIDGDLKDNGEDRFRIKIWDMADETDIYDNEIETDENEDPTTELGGGSIVIHTPKTKGSGVLNEGFESFDNDGDIMPGMLIYPNPSKDNINIIVSGKQEQSIQLKIYNSTGQLIYISSGKGMINEEISLKDNQSGLYTVIAVVDGKLIIQKVLIE